MAESEQAKERRKTYQAAYYQARRQGWNDHRKPRGPRNHTAQRVYYLKRQYGITTEDYDRMLAAQNGCCAVCGSDSPGDGRKHYFDIDHNHVTGKIRGLLCRPCNIAVGCLKESVDTAMSVAAYLVQFETVLTTVKG